MSSQRGPAMNMISKYMVNKAPGRYGYYYYYYHYYYYYYYYYYY